MRLFIFLLLFSSSLLSSAQRPFDDDYWLFETNREVKIHAMIWDRAGAMWLSTGLGLFRFNGQGDLYAVYDTSHATATALCDAGNAILVGYSNGAFGLIVNDTVRTVSIKNAAPRTAVRDILALPSGIFLAGTSEGLFAAIWGRGLLVNAQGGLAGNNVSSIALAGDSALMVGTDRGLSRVRIKNGRPAFTNYTTADGLPDNRITVVRRIPGTERWWIGCANGLARVDAGGRFRATANQQPWRWGSINDVLVLAEDHVWVATDQYLLDVYLSDSMRIRPYTYNRNHYTKLLHSRSGNLWCATGQGLSSYSIDFAAGIIIRPPYNLQHLNAMAFDRQNNLWFSHGSSLYRTTIFSDSVTPKIIGTLPGMITSLFADSENGLWIGTRGAGLWYRPAIGPGNGLKNATLLAGKDILSICKSNSGYLLVATPAGVKELDIRGGNATLVRDYSTIAALGRRYVYQVFAARSGKIWMATDRGICMYDGQEARSWDGDAGPGGKAFYTLTEDSAGNIWAGSARDGLYRFDGARWKHFTTVNGLQDPEIFTLMSTRTGQVVSVNTRGVDQWYPHSVQFRHYNGGTGPSIDSTTKAINCGATDTAGNVYIPTTAGLIVYKNIRPVLELKPMVYIHKVSVFLKGVKMGTSEFSYSQNHISFQYESANFVNIEKLNFRYFLTGYSDGWTASVNELISFPQLGPGSYELRLQASLDKDFEEAAEVTYPFVIRPPLWQRPWAIGLVLVLVSGLVFLWIKLREKRLGRMARIKQERMLFEYEHLKSQVNPHFLFNSLNTLTNLIEEDQEHAIDYTVQLSALYRNILTYRNRNTIFLTEECTLLASYMHIQKRRFGEALRLQSAIPESVLAQCSIVPLALQLLVENAINHNTVTLAVPLTIFISVSEAREVVVRNRIQPKLSTEKGAGVALQNIQKRYRLLTKKEVSYGIVDGEYIVKLPLL